MKIGGAGCAVAIEDGVCSKYALNSLIEPTRHTVLDTLQNNYSASAYTQPNIALNDVSYSSFGSLSGGGKKIKKNLVEKILKKLSKKYAKNLKTNIRDIIKNESK